MTVGTGLDAGKTAAVAAGGATGQGTSGSVVAPRLVAFYRDVWDDDGTAIGWQTVAWGLLLWDGTAISVPAVGPVGVTVWHSLDDARAELDAYVDDLGPRRSLGPVVPQSSGSPSIAGAESAAGPTACPVDPATPARDRDRPSGVPLPAVGVAGGSRP